MERVTILGVPFDPLTPAQAVERLRALLAGKDQCQVATPNNEMLVEARVNEPFLSLLNRTALNLADSTGVVWASRWLERPLPARVTGVDTVAALCAELDETVPVFFLGAGEGVAEKAAEALRAKNPRLYVAGTFAGSPKDADAEEIVQFVKASGAKLLLVAYGAPAQELWIDKHLKDMPAVRVAIGIGGTFDFLAGTKKRAPSWMRRLGLEWLYRFVQEPSRVRRMWNAVVVFPVLVLTQSALSSPKGGASPRGSRTTPPRPS